MAKLKPTVTDKEKELLGQLAALRANRREREVLEVLDAGWVPQGIRLVDPQAGEDGVTLVLTPEEAATLTEPLRKIAAARIPEAK